MKKSILTLSFVTMTALIGLSACEPYHTTAGKVGVENEVFFGNSIKSGTYRAVHSLLNQSYDVVDPSEPILVGTISDIDNLETSATFGRVLAEQISTRLTQKGYTVTELKLRTNLNIKRGLLNPNESGEHMLSRDVTALKTEQKARNVITGTYAVAGKEALVNLKLIDVKSGTVLGATDYTVDLDSNTYRLLENSGMGSFYGQSMTN